MLFVGIILIIIGPLIIWNPKYFIILNRERRWNRNKTITDVQVIFTRFVGVLLTLSALIFIGLGV